MKYDLNANCIKMEISLLNSDLEITGSERSDLELDFPDLRRNAAEEIFDISFEEGILKITQKSKKLSQFMSGDDFTVKLSVPKNAELEVEINDLSGDIKVSGAGIFKGNVKSKSGDVLIEKVDDLEAEISSISGDVIINECKGSLMTSSVSGDMKASVTACKILKAKSVSGDIEITGSFDLSEDAMVNSVSGDIKINFESYAGQNIVNLKSVSGDIELEGNKPADEMIKISTVKGDLSGFNPIGKDFFKSWTFGNAFKDLKSHFKDISDENSVSEIRETKKDVQNVQTVLNMLAEGKISADEAEKLIKAIK
ncbi:MAG TPA: DUF4097 family beta strand repeat-containing protein [Clostridiales bacterium]|nr:DUF4097 family beta strand repeat-containing protein [Clostridiales bacterium]HQP69399.1 DUF4097 family beta strand repeat-containing protein [Clostridiales bacterium]